MNVGQRLKLLEDKIISFTRDLMHFDHFAIRLLDRKSQQARDSSSARACRPMRSTSTSSPTPRATASADTSPRRPQLHLPDVERDPRYVMGLDQAKSSLTVPLRCTTR
jgi:hypothetical protein